ncbi:GNAT family N-acetyltransferase [Thalassococcus lentus]|uniref:GNAT family N-acetyltransferase n=1 Tax=Thalassococcus lentus TaxID=1210524 RepID=A0ABT4XN11_9RHOB|nr:GNAT family N-acetyltransferase [Thalassococcus lentus]MDA7423302.1 GNAT family N-acetyltransferase [Thalassococcus lentus]
MLEMIHEQDLSGSDEDQIARLLEDCFPSEYDGRSFFQQRPHCRLIWRDTRIVAHVGVFYRAVRLDGTLSNVLGIGDVATGPKYRRQGIATKLIDQALAAAPRADFAMLFGRRKLYDRAGFVSVSNPIRHTVMMGSKTGESVTESNEFLMIKQLRQRSWPSKGTVDLLGQMM